MRTILAAQIITVGLAALAVVAMMPGSATAGAYGSAMYATGRDCGAKLATQNCSGQGTTLIAQTLVGGPGQRVSYYGSADEGAFTGSFVQSDISFGVGALPIVRQSDAAVGNWRVNVNAFAYNSFVYNGDAASELSYAGNLHIVDSSGAPTGGDGNLAGGARYFGWVAIWNPALVANFGVAQDFLTNSYGNYDCSTQGVLAFGFAGGNLSGGEQNISMSTQGCSGQPFMINPGQEILAVAFLQTPVNRGGFVDASHTFSVAYNPDLAPQVLENLVANVSPTGAIPEPSTWALMIGGLGMVGAMLRRSRAVTA